MDRPEEEFERLAAPRRGEWRSVVREREQSFEDYVAGRPNRATPSRRAVVLQPLDDCRGEILERMREYAAAFLGLEARLADPLPMPPRAHLGPRNQYNSTMVLDELAARAPADAVVYLGVTEHDLFARGTAYVFGESSLEGRAGVCSLARLGGSDRRALKLVTHEAGHLLSIAHCVSRPCLMQGANTLEESDGQPLHLCPEDLRKLEWATGADRAARARRLLEVYRRLGWDAEAHRIEAGT